MQQQQILGSFVYYLEGVSYGNLFISALGPTQALILWGGQPHLRQNLEVCLLYSNSSRVFLHRTLSTMMAAAATRPR